MEIFESKNNIIKNRLGNSKNIFLRKIKKTLLIG